VRALGELSLDRREPVYWAGRATLVRRPEDFPLYDRAFAAFWEQLAPSFGAEPEHTDTLTLVTDDDGDEHESEPLTDDADGDEVCLRFSRLEVLRDKDFRRCTPDELDEIGRLIDMLRLAGAHRRSLRLAPARRGGNVLDMRRTVRGALARSGEPVTLHRRARATRPRRLVVLLDISGSMEPYARALVRFMHGAVVGRRNVEAFVIGTRLTRITRELANRNPDVALAQAGHRAPDWSGGTRLGDGLRAFNERWGARGADVVILSDGWDRGDPDVLDEQMARLARVAHRILWVNPLKVTPGYAPIARGMAAALPHVDVFLEGHSLGALEQLASALSHD